MCVCTCLIIRSERSLKVPQQKYRCSKCFLWAMIRCGDHTFTKLLPELISLPPENFLGLPSFCILHMENSTFSLTFPHYQDKHHVNSRLYYNESIYCKLSWNRSRSFFWQKFRLLIRSITCYTEQIQIQLFWCHLPLAQKRYWGVFCI